jgi:hypothetical protein
MKNRQLRPAIFALIAISAIAWFVFAWISGVDISTARNFFSLIPRVVTADMVVIILFTRWAWKFRVFRKWLVPFPNLQGTWAGELRSDWIDPETGKTIAPILVMLTIKQSFSHISCMMHTQEMKSHSFSTDFVIDDDAQISRIAYIYTSRPRISLHNRSLPHDGAIVLDIIESLPRKLDGRYWTERETRGEVSLEFCDKSILTEIPENLANHPLSRSD